MQGYQIVVYENAQYASGHKRPVGATKIIKSWRTTYKQAQRLKEKLHQKYDGIIEIQGRT